MKRIDRLSRKEERALIKRIFFLSVLSIVIAVFLLTQGVSLLGKFADVLDSAFGRGTEQSADKSAPSVPTLDDLPEATNSARLPISGFSIQEADIAVFLNSEKTGEVKAANGQFSFDELVLKNGENFIKVKAVSGEKESEFSQELKVILDTQEPKLEIETPKDGQSVSGNNRIKIMGTTDPDAQVFANGFLANTASDGKFEVILGLAEGENNIEVKATDAAGNEKTVKIKVNFNK